MDTSLYQKAKDFHNLHSGNECFIMPNAWDAGSAKMLTNAGFPAIGTSSAGIAFSRGLPFHPFDAVSARLKRQQMIDAIGTITAAVNVPVNADLESGFGDSPDDVALTITKAIEAGAVGGNIEDYTADPEKPLYDLDLAVERIKAARVAIIDSGIPFVLVARTDCYQIDHPAPFNEAVHRANLFREAGADCLFIPGVSEREIIQSLVHEIDGPLNVVMGLTDTALSAADLAELGVRRISIGGSLIRALYLHIQQAAEEMLRNGTYRFADKQLPQEKVNQLLMSHTFA